nr:hypothetical protein [Ktedonobacteraceae bacterium]
MMDAAELLFLGKYAGNQIAPIGTFVDFRTLDYFQQASDGALPADGTYILISQTSNLSATAIATAVNAVLNTSYVAGSFHARGGGDAATSQGTGADDA